MENTILILLAVCAVLLVINVILLVILTRKKMPEPDLTPILSELRRETQDQLSSAKRDLTDTFGEIEKGNRDSVVRLGEQIAEYQKTAAHAQQEQLSAMRGQLTDSQAQLSTNMNTQFDQFRKGSDTQSGEIRKSLHDQIEQLTNSTQVNQRDFRESTDKQLTQMQTSLKTQLEAMQKQLDTMEKTTSERLDAIRSSVSEGMKEMRAENTKKLDEIRQTVDEKLQSTLEKRITESFKTVSQQLEQVYKGLGEMQNLASDVGGLKKVLSGVKTRGNLGEIQLASILEDILTPEQYDTNVVTVPGKSERVEFAIRLPAKDGSGRTVYLPIDSKFPGDRYEQLLDALDSADKERIETAYKALETIIKQEAKDIRDKYISVPDTTNFGILFLPFEGLYAEVVKRRGLIETLQKDYSVNVAGPSTMAALLNSLQMGFRTLAIQKRSNEAWKVLSDVKTEFGKFHDMLASMKKHLDSTSQDLDSLIGTRTRMLERKLRSVEELDAPKDEVDNGANGDEE